MKKRVKKIDEIVVSCNGRTLSQEAWRRFRKNKMAMCGLCFLLILIVIAFSTIFIDIVTHGQFYNDHVIKQALENRLQEPNLSNWLGCDEFGRSMLFRMIWGTRYSLFIGILAISFAATLGGLLGAIAGYYGRTVDNIIMRIMDILLSIPYMLLAITIVAALGPSLVNLLISIAIPEVPGFARIVRASVMTVKEREFVEAAKAVGATDTRIIFKYIFPNAMAPAIVQATLSTANAILAIAALSYLGLGIQPPTPEWGAILSSAKTYIRDAWHITVIPGLGIMFTILALNVFGDGLRDALDPRLKN